MELLFASVFDNLKLKLASIATKIVSGDNLSQDLGVLQLKIVIFRHPRKNFRVIVKNLLLYDIQKGKYNPIKEVFGGDNRFRDTKAYLAIWAKPNSGNIKTHSA